MQSQKSLYDQINDLVYLANKSGLYDAADWVLRSKEYQEQLALKLKSAKSA